MRQETYKKNSNASIKIESRTSNYLMITKILNISIIVLFDLIIEKYVLIIIDFLVKILDIDCICV